MSRLVIGRQEIATLLLGFWTKTRATRASARDLPRSCRAAGCRLDPAHKPREPAASATTSSFAWIVTIANNIDKTLVIFL